MNRDAAAAEVTEYRQYRFSLPPGGTDVLLIRHGESQPARVDVDFPTVNGHADPPLDPHGEGEAARVAERLADEDVAAIYVTPLRRTAQTAAPLAARLELEPRVEGDLREVFLGEWEGATFRVRVSEQDPIAVKVFEQERWDVIPGAETMADFTGRVRGALERIAAQHRDERVAVFTHGGVIGAAMSVARGARPFAFLGADNASITHLVLTDEHWIVRRFNDTGHLGTDLDKPVQPLT